MPIEKHHRFHVRKGDRRTTVSLPPTLAELLALKLDYRPDDTEAHQAIRDWCQARIDEVGDPKQVNSSQRIQREAMLAVADKDLAELHTQWTVDEL